MKNFKSKNLCVKILKIKNLNWKFCCIFSVSTIFRPFFPLTRVGFKIPCWCTSHYGFPVRQNWISQLYLGRKFPSEEEPDSLGWLQSLQLLPPKEQRTSGKTRQTRIVTYTSGRPMSTQTYRKFYINDIEESIGGKEDDNFGKRKIEQIQIPRLHSRQNTEQNYW